MRLDDFSRRVAVLGVDKMRIFRSRKTWNIEALACGKRLSARHCSLDIAFFVFLERASCLHCKQN